MPGEPIDNCLFVAEEPRKETGDFLDDINPNLLKVLGGVIVEPTVAEDAMEMLVEATVFTRPTEPQGLPVMAYGKHRCSLNNEID